MADDDRATRAARAKEMLKKRQLQKASVRSAATVAAVATPPVLQMETPVPQQREVGEPVESLPTVNKLFFEHQNLEETLSSKSDSVDLTNGKERDMKEVGELRKENEDPLKQLHDQRQTIALLVTEKASLAESLARSEGIEDQLRDKEEDLAKKQLDLDRMQANLERIDNEKIALSKDLQQLTTQNSQLATRIREQEREIITARNGNEKLRSSLQDAEQKAKELEDQIQNDDRVEMLETKLKNTQDRAEEVSFQFSKLKQNYERLKEEHNHLQQDLRSKTAESESLLTEVNSLKAMSQSAQVQLLSVTAERDHLDTLNSDSISRLRTAEDTISAQEKDLSAAASELASMFRQCENLQSELRQAFMKAEDAERAQHNLQQEGSGLIRSLEDEREKVMELTNSKLELSERVYQLQGSLRERDTEVSGLESQLEGALRAVVGANQAYETLKKEKEEYEFIIKEHLEKLERSCDELQAQLNEAKANARDLRSDRDEQQQTAIRLQDEVNSLKEAQQHHVDELNSLQSCLVERQQADEDTGRLIASLRSDCEALRAELVEKNEEISRIKQADTTPASTVPRNMDDEVQNSLKQQYDLVLSSASSRIRDLEAAVYDAETKYHSLQRHVAGVEMELNSLRSSARVRGSGRQSDELETLIPQRSDNLYRFTATQRIDENVSPAVRYQRHVSLAMLQARSQLTQHAQFLDESHVFWCSCCKGDLMIL